MSIIVAWIILIVLYYDNHKLIFILLTFVCVIDFIGVIKFHLSINNRKDINAWTKFIVVIIYLSMAVPWFLTLYYGFTNSTDGMQLDLLVLPFIFILFYFVCREFQYEQSVKKAQREKRQKKIQDEIQDQIKRQKEQENLNNKIQDQIKRQKEQENLSKQKRDADYQDSPFIYKIGTHANEALAIRYGIANTERDKITPSSTVKLQKLKRIQDTHYEVLLTEYSDRKAIAVIEPGTDYVKTFYPLHKIWFKEQAQLELTLKGNGSFTLKELATFHVQKTL